MKRRLRELLERPVELQAGTGSFDCGFASLSRSKFLAQDDKGLYFVYIVSSRSGTLYIGATNSVYRRALEHKRGEVEGFASKDACNRLVYYEGFDDVHRAIGREKQLRGRPTPEVQKTAHDTIKDRALLWARLICR